MNDKKINTFLDNAEEGLKQEFLEKNNSVLEVNTDYKKVEFDYSWLEKIEETIECLDQIVRNPRKFIVQEEEIVPVERAKKITLESIKHLATHTNLIQEFDPINQTITPSKVLNINKEESFDIYENRFIYSLLINLSMFLEKRKELTKEGSNCKINKKFNYVSSTKIGNENIKINLDLESDYFEDLVGKDPSGLGLDERMERVSFIISDFMKSSFIKELSLSHVVMVKSPIRKTNVILKNTNFKKALELWEFIERYDVHDKIESSDTKNYKDEGTLKENMDEAFLLDYLILNMNNENKTNKGIKKYYINKVVKDFLNNNDDYNPEKFKKLINNEFQIVYKEKKKRENKIDNIYKKSFDKFNLNLKKALEMLK